MDWEGLIIGVSILIFIIGIIISASYINETTPNIFTGVLCVFGPVLTGLGIFYELKD